MTFRSLGGVGLARVMALAAPEAAAGTGPAPRAEAYRDQPPLAYVSEGRVLILDGVGSPPVRVPGVADACCVAFSPDSAYLAFERRGDLWGAEHTGAEPHPVAPAGAPRSGAAGGQALAGGPRGASRGAGGGRAQVVGAAGPR